MLKLAKTLLTNGYDAHKVMQTLIGGGIESLEAAQIVTQALESQITHFEIELEKLNEKVPMQEINLIWHEGTGEFDDTTYQTWDDFNIVLQIIANHHGDDRGYSKTKFQILWADDTTYEGGLDVNTKDDKNIGKHILEHLQFHTGDYCPAHLTENDYQDYLSEEEKQEAQNYLDRYDIVV